VISGRGLITIMLHLPYRIVEQYATKECLNH
jgi:hypothetical protein